MYVMNRAEFCFVRFPSRRVVTWRYLKYTSDSLKSEPKKIHSVGLHARHIWISRTVWFTIDSIMQMICYRTLFCLSTKRLFIHIPVYYVCHRREYALEYACFLNVPWSKIPNSCHICFGMLLWYHPNQFPND